MRGMGTPGQVQDSPKPADSSFNWTRPGYYGKQQQPQQDETNQCSVELSCSRAFQAKTGPRLRAEGVMAPPASDAATLRRQVAALQMDLEAHTEGEARLQSINNQLRERLELYMRQNHENVERAETELNTLHEDMEQTLELQRRLAQRASLLEKEKKGLEDALQKRSDEYQTEKSSLQARIDSLSQDLAAKHDARMLSKAFQAELETAMAGKQKLESQLREYSDQAEVMKRKIQEYRTELDKVVAKEQRDLLLNSKARRVQLHRFFQWFLEAVKEKRVQNEHDDTGNAFAKINCLRKGFHALRLATARSIQMRNAEGRQAQLRFECCWRAWRLYALAKRKYASTLERRERFCKCRIVLNWKKAVEMNKLSDAEERSLTKVGYNHWVGSLQRRVLLSWLWWMNNWRRPKQLKLQALQDRLDARTCKRALSAWKWLLRWRQCELMKMRQAEVQRCHWLQRRAFGRWKKYVDMNRLERATRSKAVAFWKLHQYHASLHAWRDFLHIKHSSKSLEELAFRHYLQVLKLKGIAIWRKSIKFQQAEVKVVQQVSQALTRAAMFSWHEFHAAHAIKKKKELKALANYVRRERKITKQCLMFWWEETSLKSLWMRLSQEFAAQRANTRIRTSLNTWMHGTLVHVLVANGRLQNDLMDVKVQLEDEKEQNNAMNLENLQLIDRLHSLSAELAGLKLAIAEKEKQEEELHRTIEDGAMIESSIQAELDQQRALVQELQLEHLKLQRKLQKKNIEDTEGEVHHTMATQKLQRSLKDLQRQLAEKSVQIEAYEKALKETVQKLEGASDESHEKLSTAFEIAAALRKILEDREGQYAALEGSCRRKEVELEEIQKKLDVAQSTFLENVEARDSRIHELENMLAQKQAEVQVCQGELQDLKLCLSARDSVVSKLEYELKLRTERENNMTRTFISGLNSFPASKDVAVPTRYNYSLPSPQDPARHHKLQQQRGPSLVDSVHTGPPFRYLTKPECQDGFQSSRSCKQQQAELQVSSSGSGRDDSSTTCSPRTSRSSLENAESQDTGEDSARTTDWKTSYALVTPAAETAKFITDFGDLEASEPPDVIDEEPAAASAGLHAEIHKLQIRIMNRLRESPGQP